MGLVRTGYLLEGWELDLLDKGRVLGEGSLIDRSPHAEYLLAHKVGYSTRRDDLQGAMYIREGSSVHDVPRSVRCDHTSY